MNSALLPSGFMDVLPPLAAAEFRLIHHFLKCFTGFGYQPVIPPLAEFTDTMLAGQGEATSHHVLKLSDPLSTHVLGLRADMTGQIARIASSTLVAAPRPLRLAYAGYTLRAAPEALKTRRQHTQVGIERFGDHHTHAIAEVLAITSHALSRSGALNLTIDLHWPQAMEALLAEFSIGQHAVLREATTQKDSAQLRALGATTIADIIDASGPAVQALARLKALRCKALGTPLNALEALVAALTTQQVQASITIDLLDLSGYGYYCGVGYALYWNDQGLEVGRGGCYQTANAEPAVGFTLYINELLERLPMPSPAPVKTIPHTTPAHEAEALQLQGFTTVFSDT